MHCACIRNRIPYLLELALCFSLGVSHHLVGAGRHIEGSKWLMRLVNSVYHVKSITKAKDDVLVGLSISYYSQGMLFKGITLAVDALRCVSGARVRITSIGVLEKYIGM